jgi:hypothetical protein
MVSARVRFVGLASLLAMGCIPAPSFELPTSTADDPFETDGPYDPTEFPDGEGSTSGPGSSSGKGSGGGSGSTDPDPSGPWDPTDETTGGLDSSSGGVTSGDDDSGGETGATGGAGAAFPPAEPFGDSPGESGLVGTWTVAWNPDGTPHWSLEIDDDGVFRWTEAGAGCAAQAFASGVLWVDGDSLVFHVDTWDKREPWPVSSVVGQPLLPPFRMRLDYANALGQLSVTGPWELTALLGWEGRVYQRDSGSGPAGTFSGRASLEAILDGEASPRVIAEDVYAMETAGGAQAFVSTQRTWHHGEAPVVQPPVEETRNWYNLSPGQAQGMISISGVVHLFDDTRLVAFGEDRVFAREAAVGCD